MAIERNHFVAAGIFAEDKPARRERLREALSVMDADEVHHLLHREEPRMIKRQMDQETWYHEGSAALRDARRFIAAYSMPRAKQRLQKALLTSEDYSSNTAAAVRMQETHKIVRRLQIYGSQIGDVRPVSCVTFNADSTQIATAGWSGGWLSNCDHSAGMCTVWSVPQCARVRNLRAHNTSASCVRFTPTVPTDASVVHLASSGHDGGVFLWDGVSEEPMCDLLGHDLRVNRVAFHPSGRFLATVWWVLCGQGTIVVHLQSRHVVAPVRLRSERRGALPGGPHEGRLRHRLPVRRRAVAHRRTRRIRPRVGSAQWPMRHVPRGTPERGVDRAVRAEWVTLGMLSFRRLICRFSCVTGSADNTIKVWDVRMRQCVYTIPAHTSLVSSVKFQPEHGHYILSSSYDTTLKVICIRVWCPFSIADVGVAGLCAADGAHGAREQGHGRRHQP